MALSDALIQEFVKLTNDTSAPAKESISYGTVVKNESATYVQLDGATDRLTPAVSAIETEDGERVTVMIKNHSAIITGNATSPAARTGTVSAINEDLTSLTDLTNSNFVSLNDFVSMSNSELQSQFEDLYKYIRIDQNGITLASGDNAITLTIDNDNILFKSGGEVIGSWDGNNFYCGNLYVRVDERARFGNFAFVPRTNGSLSFMKVGDD